MSNTYPSFANQNTSKRDPTLAEIAQGFDCGPVDRDLFNGMFNCIHDELNKRKWIHAGQFCMDADNPNDELDIGNPGEREAIGKQAVVTLEQDQVFWLNHIQLNKGSIHELQIRSLMQTGESADVAFRVDCYIYKDGDDGSVVAVDKTTSLDNISVPLSASTISTISIPNVLLAENAPEEGMWANFEITRVAATSNHTGKFSAIAARVI